MNLPSTFSGAAGARTRWLQTILVMSACLVGVATTAMAVGTTGVAPLDAGMILITLTLTVYWPGWTLARLITPLRGVGLFGASFVLGLVPQLTGWALSTATGLPILAWIIPLTAGALGTLLLRRGLAEERPRQESSARLSDYTVPLLLLGAWLLTLRSLVQVLWKITSLRDPSAWYQDLYWHLSLSAEAQRRVPLQDPQSLLDGTLSYHWFANAYSASLASTSGRSLIDVSVVWWVLPVVVAAIALLYSLTLTLSGSCLAAGCAPVLMALGPNVLLGRPFNFGASSSYVWLSPSHIFSLPVALLTVISIVYALRAPRVAWRHILFVSLAVLLSPGSKVSILPVVLAGLFLSLLTSTLRREHPLRVAALMLGCGAALLITSPLFAGGGGGSIIQFGATVRQTTTWMAHHATFGPAPMIPLAGLICLFTLNYVWMLVPAIALLASSKDDVVAVFGLGMFCAGLGAMLVLRHPSLSQVYFMRGLLPVLCAFACWGLSQTLRDVRRGPWAEQSGMLTAVLRISALAGAVITLLWSHDHRFIHAADTASWEHLGLVIMAACLTGAAWVILRPTARGRLVVAAVSWAVAGAATIQPLINISSQLVPSTKTAALSEVTPLTSAQVAAAKRLHDLNSHGDLIATNVHCLGTREKAQCDARAFWVAGLTQSPVLIGAWGYSTSARRRDNWHGIFYTRVPYIDQALYATNQQAFEDPTTTDLETLRAKEVRFLFADRRATPVSASLDHLAHKLYDNGEVALYELQP